MFNVDVDNPNNLKKTPSISIKKIDVCHRNGGVRGVQLPTKKCFYFAILSHFRLFQTKFFLFEP